MADIRKRIPLFLRTLYKILEDEKYPDIIGWSYSKDSFQIKQLDSFSSIVLPEYFKHKNYSSFIRQLNMYGFHKINSKDSDDYKMLPKQNV